MKNSIRRFLTVSILSISCLSSVAMANDNNTNISITRTNDLKERNISGDIVNSYIMSDSFIEQNEIKSENIKNCDSIIIPYGTENKKSNKTEKVVYDTIEWSEKVKANIKIGEACINGDKGRNSFNTATYIQADSKSSMFPVEAVSYLMSNLSIGEVKTIIGRNGNSVTIDYNGKKIEFVVGSDKVIINNYAKPVDNGAVCEFNDGKLFIPLRSFCNAIDDCKIDWVADEKIVNLEKSFKRKSMVKRIETVEPTSETTTESIPVIIPVITDKKNNCKCQSWCLCKKRNLGITEIKKEIINISPNICGVSGYCNCDK